MWMPQAVHNFQGAVAGGRLVRQASLQVGQRRGKAFNVYPSSQLTRCMGACLDPHHRQQLSTVGTWQLYEAFARWTTAT